MACRKPNPCLSGSLWCFLVLTEVGGGAADKSLRALFRKLLSLGGFLIPQQLSIVTTLKTSLWETEGDMVNPHLKMYPLITPRILNSAWPLPGGITWIASKIYQCQGSSTRGSDLSDSGWAQALVNATCSPKCFYHATRSEILKTLLCFSHIIFFFLDAQCCLWIEMFGVCAFHFCYSPNSFGSPIRLRWRKRERGKQRDKRKS